MHRRHEWGASVSDRTSECELVAEATQYTAQVGSHQGTVSSHRMRATPIRSRRAIREKFLKTDVAGRYVAGSYQGYVGGYVAGLLG